MSTGRKITPEDEDYIRKNCLSKTDNEIAKHLGRDIRTIAKYRKNLGINKTPGGKIGSFENVDANLPTVASQSLSEDQRREFFKTQFVNSVYYDNLSLQFTPEEINYYLEEWGSLCVQFEDIVATEKRQIDEYIKGSLMGNRILRNVKILEEKIQMLIKEIDELRETVDLENDEEAQERDAALYTLSRSMAAQASAMTSDYQKNVEMRNKLLNELNARRRDRIDQIQKGKTTFAGLIQMFSERDVKEKEGKRMELIRISREKKKNDWRQPVQFPDGVRDCVLMDEESILPTRDIVHIADVRCQALDKFRKESDKRILLVEDDNRRIQFFQEVFANNKLEYVSSFKKAKDALDHGEFDLICLDYDLGMDRKGSELAKYMIENNLSPKADILVHSMNRSGAQEIKEAFSDHKQVEIYPFEDILTIDRKDQEKANETDVLELSEENDNA